jgi:serine/threonine-protein kinase
MRALPVEPGDVVAGKYRVDDVLGRGGMGVVVLATDVDLQRPVAIKFLLSSQLDDEDALNRFLREARASAQIESPHAVRVYDSGKTKAGDPYIVMERLKGSDLHAKLHEAGPLPVDEAVDVILQACEGLAAAHARGIIHRDIKPGNLFLEERLDGTQSVKILDFGLAKPLASGTMTASNRLMGSPIYMSPEQISSPKDVDARSDIWSVGVVLYEVLTGQRPFRGETVLAICADVMNREPDPPSTHNAEIPPELDEVVLQCISRDPKARYSDIGELAGALADFGSPASRGAAKRVQNILLAPVPEEASNPSAPSALSAAPASVVSKSARRRLKPQTALALVAALGLLVWILARGRDEVSESAGVPPPTDARPTTGPWDVAASVSAPEMRAAAPYQKAAPQQTAGADEATSPSEEASEKTLPPAADAGSTATSPKAAKPASTPARAERTPVKRTAPRPAPSPKPVDLYDSRH